MLQLWDSTQFAKYVHPQLCKVCLSSRILSLNTHLIGWKAFQSLKVYGANMLHQTPIYLCECKLVILSSWCMVSTLALYVGIQLQIRMLLTIVLSSWEHAISSWWWCKISQTYLVVTHFSSLSTLYQMYLGLTGWEEFAL